MSLVPKESYLKALKMHENGMSYVAIGKAIGASDTTARRWCKRAEKMLAEEAMSKVVSVKEMRAPKELPPVQRWDKPEESGQEIEYEEPDDQTPIEEVIRRRRERFEKISDRQQARAIRPVDVKIDGPIAITHFGDPHIDDDGCNWPELLRNVKTVSSTPGMFGGNIGDTTNNWVGRLEKLWKHQTTTEEEALRLAEWLFKSVPWIYMVLGNHDNWNQGQHLIKFLSRDADVAVLTASTARIELRFPKGDPIRIVARHDFKGRSIWNRAHGPLRASKLDPWGDIYISGHIHVWVYHSEEGSDGKPRHAIIVRGFKFFDKYAQEHGFYEHRHGETCTTILNPLAKNPMERVRVVWDVEEAAEILTWYRRKL